MANIDKGLGEILNIGAFVPPAPTKTVPDKTKSSQPPAKPAEKTLDEKDFDEAREGLLHLLKKGDEALDGILDLARQGEHPRAYEVAGQLIKTLADTNKDLLNIHKQARELKGVSKTPEAQPANVTTNQTIFVGSTNDMQDLIKAKRLEAMKNAGE